MKMKPLITLGVLLGSGLFAIAQDGPPPGGPEGKDRPKRPHGPPPAEVIKQFDKDGDGKLNEEERAAMQEARKAKMAEMHKAMLEKYDADGDGKLSEDERSKAREDRKAQVLKEFDKDGDGKLSKEERDAMPKPPGGPGGPGGRKGKGKGPGGPGGPDGKGPQGPPPAGE